MKHQNLDHLFSAAQNVDLETSATEVASWVGTAAATSTGILGVAAKLKLFIAKKTFIMLGITLGSAGVVVFTTAMLGSTPTPEKVNKPIIVSHFVEDSETDTEETYIVQQDDTTEVIAPETSPIPPPPPPPVQSPPPPPPPMSVLGVDVVIPMPPMSSSRPSVPSEPIVVKSPCSQEGSSNRGSKCKTTCGSGTNDRNRKSVEGDGNVIKQDRAISSFTEIEISGIFDVIITQGDQEKVTVETDANLQEYVITKNDGATLILENGSAKFEKITKMRVFVVVKDISRIKTNGVGDLTSESTIKSSKLILNIGSVGDADLEVDCNELEVKHCGVGDLKLKGSSQTAVIRSSAVGDLRAYELAVATMNIRHSGVGDASINVSEDLTVDFSGVGDVHFKGSPKKKDITKNGIGTVKDKS